MKTITTTLSATRVTATDTYDGNRASVFRSAHPGSDNHKAAAVALCKKMGWSTKLVGGYSKPNTMVWVFDGPASYRIDKQ